MTKDKLLYVDDEQSIVNDFAEDFAYMLVLNGSITAGNKDEGIAAYKNNKDDIGMIIVDKEMPSPEDGLELSGLLRNEGYDGPLMMISGVTLKSGEDYSKIRLL